MPPQRTLSHCFDKLILAFEKNQIIKTGNKLLSQGPAAIADALIKING